MMTPTPDPFATYDPIAAHNSMVGLGVFLELLIGFALACLLVASLVDWIERRGWRPKNKQKKL